MSYTQGREAAEAVRHPAYPNGQVLAAWPEPDRMAWGMALLAHLTACALCRPEMPESQQTAQRWAA